MRERAKAGVDVRIIGKASKRLGLKVAKLTRFRLHTRTILKDASHAFIGSQSLREAELDSRREVGLIIRKKKIVKELTECFESDWSSTDAVTDSAMKKDEPEVPKKHLVRATKVLTKELHPLEATVKKAVKKAVAEAGEDVLGDKRVKTTVKKMVKKAIKQAVKEVAVGTKET